MLVIKNANGRKTKQLVEKAGVSGMICRAATMALCLLAAFAGPEPALAEPGLTYDPEHDVVLLPGCDLAIRYNNKTFVPVKAKLLDAAHKSTLKLAPEKVVKIWEDYESAGMKAAPEQIVVESYDSRKVGAFSFSRFNPDFLKDGRVREVQFTNERVAKETGLSESAFHAITALKSFEVVPKSGETPYYLYVMVSPPHTNVFVRKMRGTSRSFDFDPAVIVTQVRLTNTQDCLANVNLGDGADASSAAGGANKGGVADAAAGKSESKAANSESKAANSEKKPASNN